MKTTPLVALTCIAFSVTAGCKSPHAAPTAKPKPSTKPKTVAALKTSAATKTPTNIIYDGADNPAIQDLRQSLQSFKAGEIKLEKTELGTRTGQEFYLERKNEKTLIRYTVPTSLENAIYSLLDRWGFHWYGP